MANLQFPIYQKSLCEDLKKTFLKRSTDTDSTRGAEEVVSEVSDMLSTDIAVYAEKLLKEMSGSSLEGLDRILRSKLDVDVFSELFTALDSSGIPVDLSDKDAVSRIATIRANYGFWGVDFISALGKSTGGDIGDIGGGSGVEALYELVDVKPNASGDGVLGAKEGTALVYNGTYWVAGEAGLSETQLNSYLTTNEYVTKSNVYTKDDVYTKKEVDDLLAALKFFEKVNVGTDDSPRYALHILESMGLYSDDFISALGKSTTGGTGGGGVSYERLDSWEVYDETKSEWVLSAGLGYSLRTDIALLANRLDTLEGKNIYWSDIKNTPSTLKGYGIVDAYTKSEVDELVLFEKVNIGTEENPVWAIHAKDGMGIYSDKFISALGVSSIGDTTGLYERLDSWDSYSSEKAEWVLSAYLGNDLNSRVKALEYLKSGHKIVVEGNGSIITNVEENVDTLTFSKGDLSFSKVVDKPNTLKGYGITDGVNSFEISGEGNAFTGCNIDGHKIIFTKGETFLPRATFDELFEKVNIGTQETPIYAIRAKYGFYSDGFVSAMGINNGAGSPGLSYERLDNWSDYTEDKSGWVLSAALGYSLNTRVTALEGLKRGHIISISGSGNVVTNVSENGNTLTFTKSDLSFAKIIEKPTTIAGYGITDAKISNGVITLGGSTIKPLTAESNLAWGKITGTPTTLSGYGITDGVNAYSVSGAGNAFTGVSISGHTITFTKGGTFLPKATFDDLFEKVNVGTTDSPVYAIRAKYGLYSDSFITAMGYGSSSTGVFDRLDNWDDYDDVKATWVLSAYLGNTLNERVSYLENNPQGHTIIINGSGNVLTNVVESGSKLTFTKGEVIWSKIKDVPLGTANGLATLDASGKVPSSQLPSYVDDVLECTNRASFPATGEGGKIYIDQTTNLTYRWGGTAYVEISQSLALGETSSTAYAGDKGKKNAEDIAALQTGKADKATTLSGYGITDAYTKTEVNTKLTDGSVTKIGTKDVGSATLPVYLKAGVPTACNTTLGVSITGNSATATKLANARTLWGQSFDGSANVSGDMTGVGTITPTGEDLKVVGNLIVTGGIVMYADDGATIESGFAALLAAHIDGVTIKYNEAQQKIYSVMTGIKVNGTTYKPSETDGYITIPDYPTSLDWENIENKPSSFTPASHTHTFASLTSKPTTLSGYGITDAKIANGVITLGTATITPLTAHQTVTLASGTNNGTLKLTVGSTTTDNIAVKGLGSAAYTASSSYAAASHTHSQYLVASSLDGYVNALTDNTSTNVFVTAMAKSGKTLSYTKSFTKKSLTAASHSGWSSADTDKLIIPDMSFIAYWNGAYNSSGNSNLAYCNKGAFGDMATASKSSYYTKTEVNTKLTDGSVTKLGTANVGSGTQHFYLSGGTATASTSTVGGTAKPMYLNAGVMTAISDTVGGTAKPIFLNAGTLTAISATVGSASKPVYLSGGSVTACSYDFTSYLPLAGGTMGGTAWIVWPDSGNWGNSNSGVTFPVTRGGLQWVGQSDWVKLYSQETGSDNLNLVLQFGDDNSNGLSIRNSGGSQTAFISAAGHITAANGTINSTLKVGAIPVTNSSSGVLKIDGNLIVTGGITMYATDGVASGLMEQILVDGTTIGKKADGTLYAINTGNVRSIIMGTTTYTPNDSGAVTLPEKVTWANIEGKPSTFAPSSHTHAISQITNLQTTLDGKAAASHTHSYLPLSGGTLTGNLYINTNLYGPVVGNNPRNIYGSEFYFYNCNSSTTSTYNFGLYQWNDEFTFTYRTSADNKFKGNSFTIQGSDGQVAFVKTPKVGSTLVSLAGHTHAYLPLAGGTMSNTNVVTNLNADLLDGNHASAFATAGHSHTYINRNFEGTGITNVPFTGRHFEYGILTGDQSNPTDIKVFDDYCQVEYINLPWLESNFGGQIMLGANSGKIGYRTRHGGTWNQIKELLHQLNYTDYTVKKDGTGASGTWGISITGNAATASKITNITANDTASITNTWRRVWFSYDDNTTGRPAYSDNFCYQTSTNTLKVGTLSGNASSATKLTSSAGSATLPIYFSDGKPVACTASSVFSNLSNSGNNISVTVAGQNRTLTVGYADTVDGYHASNIMQAGWIGLYRTGGSASTIKWTRIGRFITTANDNPNNDAMIEFFSNGDQNYTYFGHGRLMLSSYGTGSSNMMLTSVSDGSIHFYATIDANRYIWLGHNAWWTGSSKYRVLFTGSFVEWYSSSLTMQTTNPNDNYITDNGTFKYNAAMSTASSGSSHSWVWQYNSSVNYATSAGNADTCDGLHVHGGRNNEANKIVRTDGSGYIQCGYINSSNGHEKNASSPTYVWGSNSSDSYLRSYQTSKLAVYTASKWATARKITLTGSVTGSVSIDGSGDVTLATTTNHTHSYLPLSGGTVNGNFAATGKVTFLNEAKLKMWNVTSTRNSNYGAEMVFVQTSIDGADPETTWPDKNRNDLFLQPKGGHVHIGPIETAQDYTCYVAGTLRATGTITAPTFSGALSGNASTASKWATARTITLSGSVTGSVSIDGSGNVTLATTTNHTHSQYLPLAGGTMTGTIGVQSNVQNGGLKFNNNNANLNAYNDQHLILGKAIRFGAYNTWDWNVWAGLKYDSSSKTIYLGLADGTTFNANTAQSGGSVRFPGVSTVYAPTFSGSLSGNASTATKLQTARTIWGQSFNGNNNVDGTLTMLSTFTSSGIYPSNNYILLKVTNGSTVWEAARIGTYIKANNGSIDGYPAGLAFYTKPAGQYTLSAELRMVIDAGGNVGIGITSPSEKLHVVGNILASGGITMYSDLRKKNILSDEVLSVKEIAAAPLFRHTYKSDDNQYIHVGTSAQYWSGIHEDWFTRKDSEGYYQMELQNLGVAMGISLAREIVTFEGAFKKYESKTDKKIRLMKKKINDLEARIKELEERRTA